MKIKLSLLIGILLMLISSMYAQSEDITTIKRQEIGDDLSDIKISHKNNFPTWLKSTKDLKGKLVLLDFWGLGCVSCVEKFPKMDSLQKEFGDKIQIILVNSSSDEKRCLEYISKLRDEKLKRAYASLPSINGDKRWGALFPHDGVPHHVWIDQEGKVMAITQGWNTTREHFKAILNGEKLKFSVKDDLVEYNYQKNGIMKQGHEKLPSPSFYSAILPPFNGIGAGNDTYIDSIENSFRITERNTSAARLYFLTNKRLRLLVNTKRIPKLLESVATDEWQQNNLFTYELKVPLTQRNNYQKYMLEDLNRFFGVKFNIVGQVETMNLPAFVLKRKVVHSTDKHLQKSKEALNINNDKMVHITTLTGLKGLFKDYENIDENRIFIDESGISPKEKLDMFLPLDMTDLIAINKSLLYYGLEIFKESREIELLVVKDK